MLYHVLIFTFHDGIPEDKKAFAVESLKKLGEIKELGLAEWNVCRQSIDNPKAKDFFQYSVFRDADHLQRYKDHPEHQRVRSILSDICDWVVVDSMGSD